MDTKVSDEYKLLSHYFVMLRNEASPQTMKPSLKQKIG